MLRSEPQTENHFVEKKYSSLKKNYAVLLVCEIKCSLLIQENTGLCHMSSMYTIHEKLALNIVH